MSAGRFDEIVALLRTDGGRVTATRKSVVRAVLAAEDHHITAAEVTAAVRRDDPDFQESTVYRTLDRLIELGVLAHAHIGHGSTVYHLADDDHRHHHLSCSRCGVVIEVPPELLAAMVRKVDKDYGFAVDADHFALTGLCAGCRPQ